MKPCLPLALTAALAFGASASSLAAEDVNNGTNPTLLTTSAGVQFKYNDLSAGLSSDLFEAHYTRPFGAKKNMSLGVTVPFASGPVDGSFGLGDVSVKFTHVPTVTARYGLAYAIEASFDTAARNDLGAGQSSVKLSGFYARFLDGGAIFAPALVQQVTVGATGPGRSRINSTTLDFYYVPKFSDPRLFMTYDPAVTRDWEKDATYASLAVTLGRMTGPALGGQGQIFVKSQFLIGDERPADGSIQVGYKILGF